MRGHTHIAGGLATASIISILTIDQGTPLMYALPSHILILTGAGMGSLLPDIDIGTSKVSQRHPIISFFSRIFTTHRGVTHSPFALILVTGFFVLLSYLYPSPYLGSLYTGIAVGYGSHLLLDILNPRGIPLFYPFSKDRQHLMEVRTGGLAEILFFLGFTLLFITVEYRMYGDRLIWIEETLMERFRNL